MNTRMLKLGLLVTIVVTLGLALVLLPEVTAGLNRHENLRARAERLHMAESRFRELVIGLRHGVSNNYDEGNAWMQQISAYRARLSEDSSRVKGLGMMFEPYMEKVQGQEALWEAFKLQNALVRNSLRYFQSDAQQFVLELSVLDQGLNLHHEILALNNALFLMALGEGNNESVVVKNRLLSLRDKASYLDEQQAHELSRLLGHASIVSQYAPVLEAQMRQLVHGEGRTVLMKFAEVNHAMLQNKQLRAGRYRTVLLASVVFLLLALLFLGLRYMESLRSRARELSLAGTVFDSSQQGIVVTNEQGDIVRVNPAFCHITGYSEEELLGKNPRVLKSGEQDKDYYRAMWQSLKECGRWQGEMTNRKKSGEHYVQWGNIDAVTTEEGDRLFVGIVSDISELVTTRERLATLAYFDTLTSLPNRVLFRDRLLHTLAQSRREQVRTALIFIDLDNFKTVNDTLGHAAGDEMLREVAVRLQRRIRDSDTVARLGGDEFVLILMDVTGPEEVARLAEEIILALSVSYRIADIDVPGGASLGISFYPDDGEDMDALMKHADVAMYRAKESGRNTYQFFTSEMATNVADALRIESSLQQALALGELSMYYQPQIDASGRLVGVEALIRWHSAELGWVLPDRFIPIAEKSGLIGVLGDFALRESCRQCVAWRKQYVPDLRISVNLSGAQFRNESLAEHVATLLHELQLPGSALELEITETVVMEDVARGKAILLALKKLGCRLAIDDFGTGYSSLAYLKRFSVDVLKIDKSFIDGLGVESDDTAVAEAILSLAHSLNLEVVAEGVETRIQLDTLKRLAGDSGFTAQGFYFSPPLPAQEFEKWLQNHGRKATVTPLFT